MTVRNEHFLGNSDPIGPTTPYLSSRPSPETYILLYVRRSFHTCYDADTVPRAPYRPPRYPGFSNVSSAATVRAVTVPWGPLQQSAGERSSQDREADLADLLDGLMAEGFTEANAAGSAANGTRAREGEGEEGGRLLTLASAATVRGETVRASKQSSW